MATELLKVAMQMFSSCTRIPSHPCSQSMATLPTAYSQVGVLKLVGALPWQMFIDGTRITAHPCSRCMGISTKSHEAQANGRNE